MRDTCRPYRDRLTEVDAASDAALAAHLQTCKSCSQLYARYQSMRVAASVPWSSAPASLIAMAKSLMASQRRTSVARRLGGTLLAGARSSGGEFQLVVGTDETSIRLMASQHGNRWQIMGRLPEGDWTIDSEHPVSLEQEGFTLDVPSLQNSRFSMVGPNETVEIPSLSELLAEGG